MLYSFVIFGVLGDFMSCKLIFVFFLLFFKGYFFEGVKIVGVLCSEFSDDEWCGCFCELMEKYMFNFDVQCWEVFVQFVYYVVGDIGCVEDFFCFCKQLVELEVG